MSRIGSSWQKGGLRSESSEWIAGPFHSHWFFVLLFVLVSRVMAVDVSILDFQIKPNALKRVTREEMDYFTGRLRKAAARNDRSWRILSRETIQKILEENGRSYAECMASAEGKCEVGVGELLQADYHVVGEMSWVGGKLVLSARVYDVKTSLLVTSDDVAAPTVSALMGKVDGMAQSLFAQVSAASGDPVLPRGQAALTEAQSEVGAVGSVLERPTAEGGEPSAVMTSGKSKSNGMDGMVRIPAGCFQMGSDDGDPSEKPAHQVCLDAYWLDAREVTNAAYQLAGMQGHYEDGSCLLIKDGNWVPGVVQDQFQGASQPVICVDWNEAKTYCESQGKRLPTEAEFEYALRAGSTTRYFWGDDADSGCRYANGADQTVLSDGSTRETKMECRDGYGDVTAPSGSFKANPWGLYDMTGNVWEWTADWSADYSSSPQRNPSGPTSGTFRIFRGGGAGSPPPVLSSSYRNGGGPGNRGKHIGFRCAGSSGN